MVSSGLVLSHYAAHNWNADQLTEAGGGGGSGVSLSAGVTVMSMGLKVALPWSDIHQQPAFRTSL